MQKILTKIIILTMFLLIGGIGSNIFTQDLVEVIDGRQFYFLFEQPKSEDSKFFDKLIRDQEATIKANLHKEFPADCKITPWVRTILEGSFTKPNSSQKAVLYELNCNEKITISNDLGYGLMVMENDQGIVNKIFSWNKVQSLKVLSDINKNGLSELSIVVTFGGTVMDYDETWIELIEYKSDDDSFDYLGKAVANWWAGLARDLKNNTANYKIFVKPSAAPKFFRETYRNIKNEKTGKTEWILTKKLEEFKLESKKEN